MPQSCEYPRDAREDYQVHGRDQVQEAGGQDSADHAAQGLKR